MKLAWAIPLAAAAAAASDWDLRLEPKGEPGPRIVVVGHVREKPGSPPLANMNIFTYHADSKGLYSLPGHEKEGARIAGTAHTNARGEYRLRTTFPGTYEMGPAHIHFEVWGHGLPRRAFVMNFWNGPHPTAPDTGNILERAIHRSAPHPYVQNPLTQDAQGVLHGAFEIVMSQGYLVPSSK